MRALMMLCCLAVLAACGGPEGGVAKLSGALRDDIPVFEPSTVEESKTFAYGAGDSFDDLSRYEGRSWDLSTTRPLAQVLAFYESNALPPAEEEVEEESDGLDDLRALWGEPVEEEEESDGDPDLIDLPTRTFRLEPKGTIEVEITVYLQPRQRKFWFSISQTHPAGKF